MQDYKTVLLEAEAEFTEKRSRFIAQVAPVKSEEEALEFLEKVRTKHREARQIRICTPLRSPQPTDIGLSRRSR